MSYFTKFFLTLFICSFPSTVRRMIVCGLLTALALTAFWMYQFLYPGSALRYWICEHGSLGDSKCNFTFIPERDTAQVYMRLIYISNGLNQSYESVCPSVIHQVSHKAVKYTQLLNQ